jgi:hypothetical protein
MLARFPAATEQWQQILLREPDYPDARARLAVLLYYGGNYAEAWSQFHAAEAAGQDVPPQLRALLAQQMDEPP